MRPINGACSRVAMVFSLPEGCRLNPALSRYTKIPIHPGDMPEGTLRAILKQAGIDGEAFLASK